MKQDNYQETITGLIDYLRYQRECGQVSIEIEAATAEALNAANAARRQQAVATPQRGRAVTAAVATPPPTIETTGDDRAAALAGIATRSAACRKCGLCQGRTRVVPGQGNPNSPDVMFIGEAPGAEEDRQGLAFVGRAGQLLTKMIAAMGYSRDEIFIANICKCRPPDNRMPTAAEMEACLPFLKEQIAIVQPRTIVAMGNTAIQGLLGSTGISRLRGIWTTFEKIPLMPTYHPAYLLRFPTVKRDTWEDLKKVLKRLGRAVPKPAPKEPTS